MRQIGEKFLTIAAALVALAMMAPHLAFAGGPNGAIVTDPLTGIAIDGYDPVTYFTQAEPQQGLSDYEYYWGGVPWYFANAANRLCSCRKPYIGSRKQAVEVHGANSRS